MKAVLSMCFLYFYYALSNYIEMYFPLCSALSVVILFISYAFLMFCKGK